MGAGEIIEAGDRDVVGHPQAHLLNGADCAESQLIGERQNGGGARGGPQRLPGDDLSVRICGPWRTDRAVYGHWSQLAQYLARCFETVVLARAGNYGDAAVTEVDEQTREGRCSRCRLCMY